MKKIYLLLIMMIALAGCTVEQPFEQDNSGAYTVNLNIRGANLSPSTYSVSASQAEYTVSDLHVLFFDADNDRYMGSRKIDISQARQSASSSAGKYDSDFTISFDMRGSLFDKNGTVIPVKNLEGKNVKFLFVANMSEESFSEMLKRISPDENIYTYTLENFKRCIVSSDIADNHFVMLGRGDDGTEVSGVLKRTNALTLSDVELQRLAAKIIVSVGADSRNEGISIAKVVLKNGIKSSYLYEKAGNPAGKSYDGTKENKEYSEENIDKIYTYENSGRFVNENALILSVELTLKGTQLKPVEIPFTNGVKRNHIYKVTLNRNENDGKDGSDDDIISNPSIVNFTIDVNDWEKDYIYHQNYRDMGNAIISNVTAYSSDWETVLERNKVNYSVGEGELGTSEVNVALGVQDTYNLLVELKSVSTQFKPVIEDKDKDWISIDDVTTYSAKVYGLNHMFRLKLNINNIHRRSTITFVNKLNPSVKCFLHLYTRPMIPIDFVADYNISTEPGVFAGSHKNNMQGYYSYSRWFDICPVGWHIPSEDEFRGIFNGELNRSRRYVSYSTSNSFNDVQEMISWGGHPAESYNSDYRNKDGLTYALRFKNTDICCAYRYEKCGRWVLGDMDSHLKVTVRYIGKNQKINVDQIAQENYWSANSGGDIIKIFPLRGDGLTHKEYGIQGQYVTEGKDPGKIFVINDHSAYSYTWYKEGCIRPFKTVIPAGDNDLLVEDASISDAYVYGAVSGNRDVKVPVANPIAKKHIQSGKISLILTHDVTGTLCIDFNNPVEAEIEKNGYYHGKYKSEDYTNKLKIPINVSSTPVKIKLHDDRYPGQYPEINISVEEPDMSVTPMRNFSLLPFKDSYSLNGTAKTLTDLESSMPSGSRFPTKEELSVFFPYNVLEFPTETDKIKSFKNIKERVKIGRNTKEYTSSYKIVKTQDSFSKEIEIAALRFKDETNDNLCLFLYKYHISPFYTSNFSVEIGYLGAEYDGSMDIDAIYDQKLSPLWSLPKKRRFKFDFRLGMISSDFDESGRRMLFMADENRMGFIPAKDSETLKGSRAFLIIRN